MIKKYNNKKIIIIGAGVAGLAACTRLTEQGFDAMILEARPHCGGRIWTDHTLGIPIGRGASWIHGIEGNPITELAERFPAKLVAVDPNQFTTFDRNRIPIPSNEVQNFNIKFDRLLKKAKELAFHSKSDISLSSALSGFIQAENFSPREWDLFENKLRFFEGYIGASYDLLSARHWDQEEAWPGENCFVATSYQSIIEGLQKSCVVRLNTIVTTIYSRDNGVEIVTDNAVFRADAAIITLPLGVLKKNVVAFDPPLPTRKQKAIQRLGMGLFNITAIKFPTPSWPKEPHAMLFTQLDDSSISLFFNLYHFTQQPILIGYNGGQRALQLENYSDKELIEKTMFNFQKYFGSEFPEPESYLNTRWAQDPFSYGSYSYLQTGSSSDDYKAMAEPVSDRLFFAGEATCSKHPATTHGAYLSGIREAERVGHLLV